MCVGWRSLSHAGARSVPATVGCIVDVKIGFRDANTRGLRMGRGFALAGGVYVACECVVEKGRGKADIWNALYGGCLAGAVLAGKSGPTGIAMGCGGKSPNRRVPGCMWYI